MAKSKAKVPDINLNQVLEEVAKEKGIERSALVETIEAAILKAAQNTFGPGRELEARFNPDKGHVELLMFMRVVEEVEDEEQEIALDDLIRLDLRERLDAELGDELGFKIYWREEDREEAEKQVDEWAAEAKATI